MRVGVEREGLHGGGEGPRGYGVGRLSARMTQVHTSADLDIPRSTMSPNSNALD